MPTWSCWRSPCRVFLLAGWPLGRLRGGAPGPGSLQRGIQIAASRRARPRREARRPQGGARDHGRRHPGAGMADRARRVAGGAWREREAGPCRGAALGGAVHRLPGDPVRDPAARASGAADEDAHQGPAGGGRLPAGGDSAAGDLRQRRQERGVQAPGRVQARPVAQHQGGRHRLQHQPGGLLPGAGERPDDLRHGLDLAAHAAEAQPRADHRRAGLRPDPQQHHRLKPGAAGRDQVVPLPGHPVLLPLVLQRDRLSAAAHQHPRDGQHLRPRAADLRDLRRHGQHLGAAGADPRGLDLLQRGGDPRQGLFALLQELAAARAWRA